MIVEPSAPLGNAADHVADSRPVALARGVVGSRWWGLGLLMVVGLVNYMDRLSLSILQVPIKRELMLSDGQMGAVTGLAFSLVYTLLAAPLARVADRYPRRLVLAGCLAVWSLMTAGCGL